jgi:hypothetical protein
LRWRAEVLGPQDRVSDRLQLLRFDLAMRIAAMTRNGSSSDEFLMKRRARRFHRDQGW